MKWHFEKYITPSNLISATVVIFFLVHLYTEHTGDHTGYALSIGLILAIKLIVIWHQHKKSKAYYQAKIKEDRSSFSLITDSLPQLVFIQDITSDGVDYFNLRWSEYTGLDPELRKDFWRQVIHPEDVHLIAGAYVDGKIPNLPAYSFEYRVKRKDGSYRWHLLNANPVKNASGKIEKWICSSTDIHEQKSSEHDRIQLINQLEQKTGVLEAVLEHMPSGVIMADDRRNIIIKNQKLINFFNMNDEFRIGSLKAFHLDDGRPVELHELPVPTTLRTGKPYQVDLNVPDSNGNPRTFHFNTSPVISKSGRIMGAVSIIDDISEAKKNELERAQRLKAEQASLATERAKEHLESLIDNIPYMIFTKDAETLRYVQVNKAVTELLKTPAEHLVGKTSHDLYTPEQADMVLKTDKEALETGKIIDLPHHEVTIRSIGTRIYNTRKFTLDRGDGKKIIVGVSHDLTEIIQARDQANLLAKMKSEFLATMSHEIRTPLNGVLAMADLVLDAPLNPQQKKYMEIVKTSGNTLLSIVNDILDFSKAEAGQIQFEAVQFDLREMFNSHFELMKMRANAKDLSFNCSFDEKIPQYLSGDPNRILQILTNLVGNAIKFTESGQISVRVDLKETTSSEATLAFSIKDSGIGIPEASKAKLFSPFVQGDGSMARRYGGTGLGLSICKQLVELMQGEITFESEKNVGSHFQFTVKLKIPTQEKREALTYATITKEIETAIEAKPNLEKIGKKHILIAEDNKTNQLIAEALVTRMGYVTHIVENGKEALEAVQKFEYDLILMDCQMPELDGYEATIQIRNLEKETNRHIPIVAFTANARAEDREKCLSVGMDDFISKPVKRDLLEQVLKTWIKAA